MIIKVFPVIAILTIALATTCNSKKNDGSDSASPTVTPGSLEYVKSIADEYVFPRNGYSDSSSTKTVSNGDPIVWMKTKSQAHFGGWFRFYDDQVATFKQNKCPSQPQGGYPLYHSSEGGYLHIYNGVNLQYRMIKDLKDIPAEGDFYYVCRLYLSTTYEAIMSGYGGPELKVFSGTKQLQFSNGDYKTSPNVQAFAAPYDTMQTVIYRFLYKNNSVSIFVTDNDGDNRLLTKLDISPNSFFRNFGVGTVSHPMTHDFFGYVMKFGGNFSDEENKNIISELKANFPVGKRPDKPLVFPQVSSVGNIFKVKLNFAPSASNPTATFDSARSTIRWYLINNIDAPSGNGLDEQVLIKQSNCKDLTLDISSSQFKVFFKKVQLNRNGTNKMVANGVAVDVTCVDSNGDSFEVPLTSFPENNLY